MIGRRRAPYPWVRAAVVLFNRDLRVHDHPALTAPRARRTSRAGLRLGRRAAGLGFAAPNRLRSCSTRWRTSTAHCAHAARGSSCAAATSCARRCALAREAGAEAIFTSDDVSAYAQARERRLRAASRGAHRAAPFPGATIVPPGDLTPAGGDHFRVFTPYLAALARGAAARRARRAAQAVAAAAESARATAGTARADAAARPSPELPQGGEQAGPGAPDGMDPQRASRDYGERHDDLAGDATSRLSPYLRFGCVSPRELLERCAARPGASRSCASSAGATSTSR